MNNSSYYNIPKTRWCTYSLFR